MFVTTHLRYQSDMIVIGGTLQHSLYMACDSQFDCSFGRNCICGAGWAFCKGNWTTALCLQGAHCK